MAPQRVRPRRASRPKSQRWWILPLIGLLSTALWLAEREGPGLLAAGWIAAPPSRICRLSKVLDGDSLMLDCDGESVEVRLHCIDAPERDQIPWGKQSRRHLRNIATGEVEFMEIDLDRFGRTVGDVYTTGPDRQMLNLDQVTTGQAAVFTRYCDDPRFFRAEREAREAGIGIWSRPGEQQTPWEFRHRARR